ncbi:MAG: hypothetical protein ACTSXW_03655 [Candidatus Baldrarchaeia archaeon]
MRLTRFIAIFLIFSISLSIVTVIRGLTPYSSSSRRNLLPNGSSTTIYRWPPRTVRIELRSTGKLLFEIYYYLNGENHTVIRKFVERGIFTVDVQRRGLNTMF